MIIRWCSPRIGLVQRVISVMMYGNGASKQVSKVKLIFVLEYLLQMYNFLWPLMICLSYNGTMKQMKNLDREFDALVLEWSKTLTNNVKAKNSALPLILLK